MDSLKLDTLLDELADLAQQSLPQAEFYASILRAVLPASRAAAAGLWSVIGEKYRLESDAGLLAIGLDADPQLQAMHEEALATVSGLASDSELHRATSDPLLLERQHQELEFRFFPCRNRGRAFLVLEVVTMHQSGLQWDFHSRLFAAVAEIVNDHYTQQRLNWLEGQQAVTGDLIPVLSRIYTGGTLPQTAYQIANEGRRFLDCDRISVFQFRQRRCVALCISGVDRIQNSSRHMRSLCDLTQSVALTGKKLIYSHTQQHADQYLPQQSDLLQQYVDSSSTTSLHIVPLFPDELNNAVGSELGPNEPADRSQAIQDTTHRSCIGVMAIEGVHSNSQLHAERLGAFQPHAQRALHQALNLESTPLLALGRRLQRLDRTAVLRRLAVVLVCLLVGVVLFVIPADLTVQAKGRYQPSEIQHIYAPLNGEIIDFPNTERTVKAGEQLVVMRSREWELKREELLTQRGVTLEKLRGVESARLNSRRSSASDSSNVADLSANERELRELLASQDQQLSIIEQLLQSLTITSPIEGSILSWNPLESWELRPVQQGQKLMTIAREGDGAELHLRVRDSDIRHVWAAHAKSTHVPISFAIASDPGERFTARLTEIGTLTESLNAEGPCVRLSAMVADAAAIRAKHGTTVVARIRCGRTSVAYAWTRRLCDYLTMYWLP